MMFLTLGVRNQTFVFSTSNMGGYLEARTTDPNRQLTPWKPVCGGCQWTNKEALVACNQLRYHNTTTIGKYIHEDILYCRYYQHFKCTRIAITSGQCSPFDDAVEISGCKGVETTLEDCITTLSMCNNWGGIICSCKLLYKTYTVVNYPITNSNRNVF